MAVDRWWTDERVDELKARWQAGETGREIQFNMGARSRNAVIGKANRLGLWRATVQNNAARVSNKARRKASKGHFRAVEDLASRRDKATSTNKTRTSPR